MNTQLSRLLCALIFFICSAIFTNSVNAQSLAKQSTVKSGAVIGDSVATWFKDKTFRTLYEQALGRSPVNSPNSWVYKDAGIAPSMAITGQNANTWVRLSTCASKNKLPECRLNHIDVFYDPATSNVFGYLSIGNRQGWIGAPRAPTSMEQKFLLLHTTRDLLQK